MRIEQLTFTRFFPALAIVVFHYGAGTVLFSNPYLSVIFRQANIFVSFFYVLSGFVMMVAYRNVSAIRFIDFFNKRLARIFPVYLFALLITIWCKYHFNIRLTDTLLHILMLQAWVPGKALTLNFPAWSISVELFFYLVFPFLFNRFYRKWGLKKLTIAILVFWLLSQFFFLASVTGSFHGLPGYATKDLYYHPILHLNEFLIGILAGAWYVLRLQDRSGKYSWFVLLYMALFFVWLKWPNHYNYHNGLLAVYFAPLIILLALNRGWLTNVFSLAPLIFLGEISFCIYILQNPVWTFLDEDLMNKYFHLSPHTDLTIRFLLRVSILIFFSAGVYVLIEKPAREKWIRLYKKINN